LFPGISPGIGNLFPELQIIFYADGKDARKVQASLEDAVQWFSSRLGNHVYSDTGDSMEQVVGTLLKKNKATLALAESCTGGLIASLLTDVPGSSDYFLFSAVTYANQSKLKALDVDPQTLKTHGAVSEQTAREMARGARQIVDATYGLSTSGIAGPGGGSEDKPVGTVCIGLATQTSETAYRFTFSGYDRKTTKRLFAICALNLLRKELLRA
jgi:nicotinamide-nucleotide amidase